MERIFLDMLSQDSVSLRKQKYTEINGIEYHIGNPWRRLYTNSERGRELVNNEVSEPYKSAIIAVWGDTPTVTEYVL